MPAGSRAERRTAGNVRPCRSSAHEDDPERDDDDEVGPQPPGGTASAAASENHPGNPDEAIGSRWRACESRARCGAPVERVHQAGMVYIDASRVPITVALTKAAAPTAIAIVVDVRSFSALAS